MIRILLLLILSSAPALGDPLALSSQARGSVGLPPLRADPVLERMAQSQAAYMASQGKMSHRGRGGASLSARARAAGHKPCVLAENVAYGQTSVPMVTQAWLASPGHRANILDPRMNRAAVAGARGKDGVVYWAMVIAGPC